MNGNNRSTLDDLIRTTASLNTSIEIWREEHKNLRGKVDSLGAAMADLSLIQADIERLKNKYINLNTSVDDISTGHWKAVYAVLGGIGVGLVAFFGAKIKGIFG